MKKNVLGLILAASLGLAGVSFAATSANLTIYVTVTEAGQGIQLLFGPDYFFGNLAVSSSQIDGANGTEVRIFRNVGSGQANFSLQMGQWLDSGNNPLSTQWTYLTTAPTVATGVNTVRLGALWQLTAPVLANFLADDTLSTSAVTSTTDVYGLAATATSEKGFNVPATGERTLHLLLQTPATGSANLAIPVHTVLTVTAI